MCRQQYNKYKSVLRVFLYNNDKNKMYNLLVRSTFNVSTRSLDIDRNLVQKFVVSYKETKKLLKFPRLFSEKIYFIIKPIKIIDFSTLMVQSFEPKVMIRIKSKISKPYVLEVFWSKYILIF